jgi:phospholipase C
MKLVTRRTALQMLGSAGLGALAGACGPATEHGNATDPAHPGADGGLTDGDGSDAGEVGEDHDGGPLPPDAGHGHASDGGGHSDDDAGPAIPPTPEELLSTIDTVVVLLMENRSFDHLLGSLRTDQAYAQKDVIEGLRGTETNPSPTGEPVQVWKMANFTPEDPPHDWDPVHAQWNQGANDGFVKAHAGASESEVMGFHDRSQIPFYYWLADNFTVCDHWFCSVLGPTWPNRYYMHATSSNGKKDNTPGNEPPNTIWDRLKARGQNFKNYFDGPVPWFAGGFLGKLFTNNPTAGIAQFFKDAQAGTLPRFSLIDPDFTANDDHPSHDIMRGQAFVASVYKALAASPQWSRCLFVVTYDEHGGFYDHVPPPAAEDENPEFAHLGFRVPALVIGPTVRRGHVNTQVLEHSSVAATLRTRFGIESLSKRMDAANDLSSCIDPARYKNPSPPPADPPPMTMSLTRALTQGVGQSSQPQLDAMVASGEIPAEFVDHRPAEERIRAWLAHGERLGAVRLTD